MDRGAVIVGRKVGERVVIGKGADRIVVEVLKPKGAGARLRVEAPVDVAISRDVEKTA